MHTPKQQIENPDSGAERFITWLWVNKNQKQTRYLFNRAMSDAEISHSNSFLDEIDKTFDYIKATEKLWLFSTSWRIQQIEELQKIQDAYFSEHVDLTSTKQ